MKTTIAGLLSLCWIGSAAAQDQILVKFSVYRARGDVSGTRSLTDNIWAGLGEPGKRGIITKGPFTFFTVSDLVVAAVRLKATEDGWTWDGKPEPPPTRRARTVKLIASPQVIQQVGKQFEVSVTPSEPVEYFEAREDGLFARRVAEETPGLRIATKLEEGVDGRVVLRNLALATKAVVDREPVPGVRLPVGRPVFESEKIETTISLRPGRDYGIQVVTKREGLLLVRVRVERLGKP